MKNSIYIYLLLIASISFSCTTGETIIEGHVLQLESEQPLVGAKVEIRYGKPTNIFSGTSELVDTIFTDNDGYFRWSTNEEFEGFYRLGHITIDNHYRFETFTSDHFTMLNPGDQFSENIYMTPLAYLNLKFINVPEIETNYIQYFGRIINGSLSGIDRSFSEVVKGNNYSYNTIGYSFEDGGITMKDTIYVPAFDTLDYIIQY